MMDAKVVSLPSALAERIRTAFARTVLGHDEWIEGTIELAMALAEARGRFAADQDFSRWLGENELDLIGRNERSALINMASDIEFTRIVLQETRRTSWRLIWDEEIAPRRFHSAVKPDTSDTNAQRPRTSVSPTRGRLIRMPRGNDIAAIFTSQNTRGVIASAIERGGGDDLRELILQAIDAGFATMNNIQFERISLRVLFTGLSKRGYGIRFDLVDAGQRAMVREKIMPIAMANREAILADPNRIGEFVHREQRHNEPPKWPKASVEPNDVEAARMLLDTIDHFRRTSDTIDLASARRGLSPQQRRDMQRHITAIRIWLDVMEVSQ